MKQRDGFTMVELMVSIGIATVLASVLFAITFTYYADVLRARSTALLATESQQVLRSLVEDIRLADAIGSTNTISDANGPTGGWATNDPSDILIIQTPAINSNRDILYDPDLGVPYSNEYIYFKNGTTIYRRVLKNPTPTDNTAVTTCPAASATSACPADKLLSANINNLSFTFYDEDGNTTANATLAESVLLTVNLSKKSFGKNITFTNSVRVALRNR